MFYRPNFCNNCGEAVERFSWKLWTSTHFCENCESNQRTVDWLPKICFGISLILGLFGFGTYLKTPESQLTATNSQFAAASANKPKAVKPDLSANAKAENKTTVQADNNRNTSNVLLPNKSLESPEIKRDLTQNQAAEPVYFCGAQTKKGNPCTRKVKGGGRCWQHAGQSAMLAKRKLAASQ